MARGRHGQEPELRLIIAYKVGKSVVLTVAALVLVLSSVGLHDQLRHLALSWQQHVTHAWSVALSRVLVRATNPIHELILVLVLAAQGLVSAAEAWILHRRYRWGPWVVAAMTALPLPVEILLLVQRLTIARVGLFAGNALIFASLIGHARRDSRRRRTVAESRPLQVVSANLRHPKDSEIAALASATYTVGSNRVALLRDGLQAFPAMLRAIAEARQTVCLETYMLRDDHTGSRFADALCARARAGVEVSLIYDSWGSSVSAALETRLREAGVRIVAFHRFRFGGWPWRFLSRMWHRDHRKLLVVDGRMGYLGGLNLADDYAAPEDHGRGWRDTNVSVEGPAAIELQRLFMLTWRRSGGMPFDARRYGAHDLPDADARVRIIGSSFRACGRAVRAAYLAAITRSQHSVLLTSAYFLPPRGMRRALYCAARRGVKVSIIVAGTTDVPAVLYAGRAAYGRLIRAGIRIFEWHGRVLHAKTASVDGRWATVGSSNLDTRSLLVDLEVNAIIEDEPFAMAVEAMFVADLANCTEVTLANWALRPFFPRALSAFLVLFRRWM
ncbi:MAG: DUF2127 domain-containing protein [Polyangia bacterium]